MWTEAKLNELLTTPQPGLVEDMKKINGDILVLGAGGKMGPTLCVLAKKAMVAAGVDRDVIAVSRFSDPIATAFLEENGVKMISCDLLEPGALEALPEVDNVIFMAGKKFGTNGNEYATWGMNVWLPSRVAERYKNSRIVAFSSGNLYPKVPLYGGATEDVPGDPIGEYAMTCLGRERMFEYGAKTFGTSIALFRLNYAIDLRYGVIYDIANKIMTGTPIDITTPSFNCIWQADANAAAIRLLLHASPEVFTLNVTGPENASVVETAKKLGRLLGKEPVFTGTPSDNAYLSNAGRMFNLFGYPTVSLETMIGWQAEWILSGGRALNKPTHFEERKGSY
ncbi:MAG: NAD(P)-dependent oxidoreductase [Ruminococcaceae bacterium]|nr:NAD(P)-dependent oxidoreductase [Oscillospiraceae bacterium]